MVYLAYNTCVEEKNKEYAFDSICYHIPRKIDKKSIGCASGKEVG